MTFPAASMSAGVPPLPITESSQVAAVGLSMEKKLHFIYYLFAIKEPTPEGDYYSTYLELIPTNSAAPLRATFNQIHFQAEDPVGQGNQEYRTEGGGNRLTISGFDQSRLLPGAEWRYIDVGANAPPETLYAKTRRLTEFFLGYCFPDDDGTHFGWLKFTRSDTTFTNVFDLTAYEWNPIPEAPIRAGLPPEIPVATEVVEDGSGQPVLQVSWNPALATWIFETTTDLTPPVTWTEYPAGGTSAEVPLDGDDTHRYFRLRRP